MKRNYIWQLLIGLDQLGNTILAGWADETISSRSYRTNYKKRWKLMEFFVNALFFFDKEERIIEYIENGVIKYKHYKVKHCQLAYEYEKARGHNPIDLREKDEDVFKQ